MWHLALVFLSILNLSEAGKKCRVLALGGNTDRGAYVAGGVAGLVKNLPAGEAEWDVVTGNGNAAISAYILAQTAKGEESTAAETLSEFWTDLSWRDMYRNWPGWVVTGMFIESGLYNAAPMYKTVEKLDKGKFERSLGVGATDLLTAQYVYFNNTKLSMDTMKVGVKASASQEGFYQYVEYKDLKLLTGTIKYPVDIYNGIDLCQQKGFKPKNIIVDIVTEAGANLPVVDPSKYNTIQNVMRFTATSDYDNFMQDITSVERDDPDITIRSIIYPLKPIRETVMPYQFTKAEIKSMIEQGNSDAAEVLKKK